MCEMIRKNAYDNYNIKYFVKIILKEYKIFTKAKL